MPLTDEQQKLVQVIQECVREALADLKVDLREIYRETFAGLREDLREDFRDTRLSVERVSRMDTGRCIGYSPERLPMEPVEGTGGWDTEYRPGSPYRR